MRNLSSKFAKKKILIYGFAKSGLATLKFLKKIKSDMNGQLTRLRVGIKPEGKVIAREGTKIFSEDNEEIGSVTSGTFGPSINSSIAMGYVKYNYSKAGTKIFLEVRGKKHEARISELPFYKKKYVR